MTKTSRGLVGWIAGAALATFSVVALAAVITSNDFTTGATTATTPDRAMLRTSRSKILFSSAENS